MLSRRYKGRWRWVGLSCSVGWLSGGYCELYASWAGARVIGSAQAPAAGGWRCCWRELRLRALWIALGTASGGLVLLAYGHLVLLVLAIMRRVVGSARGGEAGSSHGQQQPGRQQYARSCARRLGGFAGGVSGRIWADGLGWAGGQAAGTAGQARARACGHAIVWQLWARLQELFAPVPMIHWECVFRARGGSARCLGPAEAGRACATPIGASSRARGEAEGGAWERGVLRMALPAESSAGRLIIVFLRPQPYGVRSRACGG